MSSPATQQRSTDERFTAYHSMALMADAVAAHFRNVIQRALKERGRALVALSGGRTPEPTLARLAHMDLPWDLVTLAQVDERWVPPQAADSNARMLQAGLSAGPAKSCRFLPLLPDLTHPIQDAERADAALRALVDPFDLILLGMGDDGHTASLFPHTKELQEALRPQAARRCLSIAAQAPAPPQPRLTMTLTALLNSRQLMLLITGDSKRQVLESAFAGDDPLAMPVRAILHQTQVPVSIAWAPET